MVNRVVLVGRLTRDPELRKTATGVSVASFTLAVDNTRKNPDGTWHEERGALCIFCGEDLDYDYITEDEASRIIVRY